MSPNQIRALRERLKLSGEQFAAMINAVNPTFLNADRNIVSRWERGVATPNQHYQAVLYRLAGDDIHTLGPIPDAILSEPGESMDRYRFAELVREYGPDEMTDIVAVRPERKVLAGIEKGWNLIDWHASQPDSRIMAYHRLPRGRLIDDAEVIRLRAEKAMREAEKRQLRLAQSGNPAYAWDRLEELRSIFRTINDRLREIDPREIAVELVQLRRLPNGFPGRAERLAEVEARYEALARPDLEPVEGVIYLNTEDDDLARQIIESAPYPMTLVRRTEVRDAAYR